MARSDGSRVTGPVKTRLLRLAECASYLLGCLLFGVFAQQLAWGELERQEGLAAFDASQASQGTLSPEQALDLSGTENPDISLWAPGRVADYQASLEADLPEVIGVLEIESVGLKVPLYSTNTELVMDRGAGIIDGMAYPHEEGNIGISGHRDGYFRVLKDVQKGDRLTLQTLAGPKEFRIDSTRVVEIEDQSVLQDTDEQTVTLITCYPFYFVGHAPQRFIVSASLDTHHVN